jgi:hypothetical protein
MGRRPLGEHDLVFRALRPETEWQDLAPHEKALMRQSALAGWNRYRRDHATLAMLPGPQNEGSKYQKNRLKAPEAIKSPRITPFYWE